MTSEDLQRRVNQHHHDIAEIYDLVARIERRQEATERGLQQLHEEVGGLHEEVGGLREEVGGLRGEVGGLRGEVRDLQGGMAQVFDLVVRIDARTARVERKLN